MSKYGVFYGPYFPAFSPNTGKCGPEKTLYLDTFHSAGLNESHKKFSFEVLVCLYSCIALLLKLVFAMTLGQYRDAFRTQLKINDEAFFPKYLKAKMYDGAFLWE